MIHLDFHDPRPMYEQVVEQFEMLIARGALAADERIPSVRQLSVQLSLNPNTVQKAYSELLSRGEIYSVRGKGNFVSGDQTGIRNKKLEQIRGEMLALLRQAKEFGASAYSTVTLEVTPREAEMLAFTEQIKGRLVLTLRNRNDTHYERELPQVNFDKIVGEISELNEKRQQQKYTNR